MKNFKPINQVTIQNLKNKDERTAEERANEIMKEMDTLNYNFWRFMAEQEEVFIVYSSVWELFLLVDTNGTPIYGCYELFNVLMEINMMYDKVTLMGESNIKQVKIMIEQ